MKLAGIHRPGVTHLRHSCAAHMLENGANIRYIQALLGHASVATTEIYLYPRFDRRAAADPSGHAPGTADPHRAGGRGRPASWRRAGALIRIPFCGIAACARVAHGRNSRLAKRLHLQPNGRDRE